MAKNEVVNPNRVRKLNQIEFSGGPIIYWMQRDQRTRDNWALLHAQQLAFEYKSPLMVIFCLTSNFLDAPIRHYGFMLKGLQLVKIDLNNKLIPFRVLTGNPEEEIISFAEKNEASAIVTDFNPLKIVKKWKEKLLAEAKIPVYEVDAHNVVPCWKASPKQEYGAYTIRPKIKRLLPEYLEEIPPLIEHRYNKDLHLAHVDWDEILNTLKVDNSVAEVNWIKPGEKHALKALKVFIDSKLDSYNSEKNDPNKGAISNMSPYLHFGQISAQRIALEISDSKAIQESIDTYLEELIVRRELSDNFCFYKDDYDSLSGLPDWAKKTLEEHKDDIRAYTYSLKEFENASTHDDLWNAAQIQMVTTGKMHGYMRMYWAKKILEWTKSPQQALEYAIYLNDKYELDGRDPNGYAGILWSIGGLHDRAWKERHIFGKIRYMSYNGAKSKFDIKQYIHNNSKKLCNQLVD